MSILGRLFEKLPSRFSWPIRRYQASRRRSISQIGQDFWVACEVFNEKKNGFFVDLGAADGYDISNTFLLETRYGWTGICVEANRSLFGRLRERRRAICVNACIDGAAGTVNFNNNGLFGGIVEEAGLTAPAPGTVVSMPTVTLLELLDKYNAPRAIDFLSIDVEGAEERILLGFDFKKYMFRCMTIERPSDRLRRLLADNGYQLVRDMPGLDAFYIHASFLGDYAKNAMDFWSKSF